MDIAMARTPRTGPPDESRALAFPTAVRVRAGGIRAVIRNVDEALDMIDRELPAELRRLPRWTFARALLEEARRTQRKRDLTTAIRQLRQALSNEKWLADDPASA